MKPCLLDTGPLVALIDRSEPEHGRTVEFMRNLRARLITTGAVVTEAFHFLSESSEGPARLVAFLTAGNIEICDVFDFQTLSQIARFMKKYADTPMDFADATLVWVAENTGTGDIITLDHRGFSTYRFSRNRKFNLLLDA